MIKAIVFDLGEVVLTNDWHYESPEKFAAYTEYFGITYDQMEEGWKKSWPDYELGKITEDEFWSRFLAGAGAKKMNIEKAKELWRKYFGAKDLFDLLDHLKKNYILAVASSTGNEWLSYKREAYQLDNYFNQYVTTSQTGLKKTSKEFFSEVTKELNEKPSEVLFIDDAKQVIDVAKDCGFQTILYENKSQLLRELKKLAIL